jgi:hypothetical protein
LQLGDLLLEAGDLLLVVLALQVTKGPVGLAVQRWARDASLLGVPADLTVLAEEDDPGAGQTLGDSYHAQG